jgi:hypothetical protein
MMTRHPHPRGKSLKALLERLKIDWAAEKRRTFEDRGHQRPQRRVHHRTGRPAIYDTTARRGGGRETLLTQEWVV